MLHFLFVTQLVVELVLQGFIKDQSRLVLIARVIKERIAINKLMGILIFDMGDAYF